MAFTKKRKGPFESHRSRYGSQPSRQYFPMTRKMEESSDMMLKSGDVDEHRNTSAAETAAQAAQASHASLAVMLRLVVVCVPVLPLSMPPCLRVMKNFI